jgi:hypothetical protein
MEAYLEAIDIGIYKAATQGFPEPRDPTNLVGEEFNYEKWNAKAKNTLLEAFAKMCLIELETIETLMICGWTYVLYMKELEVSVRRDITLLWENANAMYSRLNILVEEVNGLGLTQISQPDVVRKILSVLPIDKYGHIVTVPHQMDLSVATPTQILGNINVHEMYMHIIDKW